MTFYDKKQLCTYLDVMNITNEAVFVIPKGKFQELDYHRRRAVESMSDQLPLWDGRGIVDGSRCRHHLGMIGMILDEILNNHRLSLEMILRMNAEGPSVAPDDPSKSPSCQAGNEFTSELPESQAPGIVHDFLRPEFYANREE